MSSDFSFFLVLSPSLYSSNLVMDLLFQSNANPFHTTVCAVSSRYFFERPGLYKIAMHFAKAAAASTVVDGWKTVETCQAYLILAAYGFPTRRFEEDRGWCYTAIATRYVPVHCESVRTLRILTTLCYFMWFV